MVRTRKVRVDGILLAGHKSPAVEVSFDPAAELGVQETALWPGRRGYPVEVLLSGVRFRSAIVSRMRRFFVLVEESIARRAGLAIGDAVNVTMWADSRFDAKEAQGGVDVERSEGVRLVTRGKRRRRPRG